MTPDRRRRPHDHRANDVGLVINLGGGRTSFGFDDPYWAQFQLRPEEAGFVRLSVPGQEAIGRPPH